MPCRAAPPPPPPPHSTVDLSPSPASLSNPLVYRLRTCCLQEFLPRVSLASHPSSSIPSSSASREKTILACACSSSSSSLKSPSCSHCSSASSTRRPSRHSVASASRRRSRPGAATQLCALFQDKNSNAAPFTNIVSNYDYSSNSDSVDSSSSLYVQDDLSSSSSSPQDPPSPTLSTILSQWQSPASIIPLSQLQTALAHRFLKWALSEGLVRQPLVENVCQEQAQEALGEEAQEPIPHNEEEEHIISIDQKVEAAVEQAQQPSQSQSIAAAGQDWAAAHDLIWPEGDYFMAQKTFIREGVAHLKRGRRYIFVEPVLGPATSYLYPKWADPAEDHDDAYEAGEESMHDGLGVGGAASSASGSTSALASARFEHGAVGDGNDAGLDEQDKDDEAQEINDPDASSSEASSFEGDGREGQEEEEAENDKETDQREVVQDDVVETEDRAQAGLVDKGVLPCDERVEKEDADETSTSSANSTNPTSTNNNNTTNTANTNASSTVNNTNATGTSTSTSTSANTNPSSPQHHHHHDDDSHHQHQHPNLHSSFDELMEPYSPLLDPSTDGQDQFEYGLYELQYIPKVQHLLPHQFLPTRQSFIVHLDEDRPTLASPVPIYSKRSECRCQLMMRKVLMQRDLLQVWPPIAPVRTLLERQQEAEEEARMMEIKQKVQMQTKNWRETLQTQVVACG